MKRETIYERMTREGYTLDAAIERLTEKLTKTQVERDEARILMRDVYDRWLNGPADALDPLFENIEEGYPWLVQDN